MCSVSYLMVPFVTWYLYNTQTAKTVTIIAKDWVKTHGGPHKFKEPLGYYSLLRTSYQPQKMWPEIHSGEQGQINRSTRALTMSYVRIHEMGLGREVSQRDTTLQESPNVNSRLTFIFMTGYFYRLQFEGSANDTQGIDKDDRWWQVQVPEDGSPQIFNTTEVSKHLDQIKKEQEERHNVVLRSTVLQGRTSFCEHRVSNVQWETSKLHIFVFL